MTVILSLDLASDCGFAIIDTDKTYSQIELGHRKFAGEPWEKSEQARSFVRELKKKYDFRYAAIEMPFTIAPQYQKKKQTDLVGETDRDAFKEALSFVDRLKAEVQRGGSLDTPGVQSLIQGAFGSERTINPKTMAQLNWLAGAVQVAVMGCGCEYEYIRPQTWMSIIPPDIKKTNGNTKNKVRLLCDRWGIVGGDENARDAAVQGVWCRLKSQKFKQFNQETLL
jgi:hypothetical protein